MPLPPAWHKLPNETVSGPAAVVLCSSICQWQMRSWLPFSPERVNQLFAESDNREERFAFGLFGGAFG